MCSSRVSCRPNPVVDFWIAGRPSDDTDKSPDFGFVITGTRQDGSQGKRSVMTAALGGPMPDKKRRRCQKSHGLPEFFAVGLGRIAILVPLDALATLVDRAGEDRLCAAFAADAQLHQGASGWVLITLDRFA